MNIEKEISSIFDSVDLINSLNLIDDKSQEDIDCLTRNVEHLKIKMNQVEFVETLNENQIKIITSLNMKYKQVRGSEPDINMAYFRVRKSKDQLTLFYRMFPHVNTKRFEECIFNLTKYIHKMYVRRFIKKQYTVIHPVLYQMMKVAHSWHCLDRTNNIITLEKLLDLLDEQPYMNVYQMYNEFTKLNV